MFFQGIDIITMTLTDSFLNCYNNISTDHFVLLYIPSFNLGIFMIKAFLFQEKDTFLSRAYYQFLMPVDSSLDNNFEEISVNDIPHCSLSGNTIHMYTVEHDDPMLCRLFTYLYHSDVKEDGLHMKVKNTEFRNILLGTE